LIIARGHRATSTYSIANKTLPLRLVERQENILLKILKQSILIIFFCHYLFTRQKQENRYETQRVDIMVNGKITTKFIPLPGRILCFSIDGTEEASADLTVTPDLNCNK